MRNLCCGRLRTSLRLLKRGPDHDGLAFRRVVRRARLGLPHILPGDLAMRSTPRSSELGAERPHDLLEGRLQAPSGRHPLPQNSVMRAARPDARHVAAHRRGRAPLRHCVDERNDGLRARVRKAAPSERFGHRRRARSRGGAASLRASGSLRVHGTGPGSGVGNRKLHDERTPIWPCHTRVPGDAMAAVIRKPSGVSHEARRLDLHRPHGRPSSEAIPNFPPASGRLSSIAASSAARG